ERVGLVELLAVVVPRAAQLPAAAHVGDGEHEPAIEERQPQDREGRVHRRLIGAVAVQEARGAAVVLDAGPMHVGDGDAGAVGGGGPEPARLVGGGVVAADHLGLLQQGALAGGQVLLVDAGRRDERGVGEPEGGGGELRVGGGGGVVHR